MRLSDWSSDVCSSDLWPKPWKGVTLLALNSIAMPPVNCFTMASLRPTILATSIFASLKQMPCWSNRWPMFQYWREESSSALEDRKSVVEGKRVSVRVDLGGRRIIYKKKHKHKY